MYYYLDNNGTQQGPVDKNLLRSLGVTADTMVWKKGMEQWVKASLVPELRPILISEPVDTPPTPPSASQRPATYETGSYNKDENSSGGTNAASAYSAGTANQTKQAKPNNNLIFAIVTTVMCCLPLGGVAIYYAIQSDSAYNAGDLQAAEANGKSARNWSIAGVVLGAVGTIIYVILMMIGAVADSL